MLSVLVAVIVHCLLVGCSGMYGLIDLDVHVVSYLVLVDLWFMYCYCLCVFGISHLPCPLWTSMALCCIRGDHYLSIVC